MNEAQPSERLDEALRSAGFSSASAIVHPAPSASAPPPPEGPWVILPHDGWAVGGVSRGAFRPYTITPTIASAIDQVLRLLGPPTAPPVPRPSDMPRRGEATSRAITGRTLQRGGQPGPAQLAPGDVLDVLGTESGHHLFAWGTPFPQRSQPPTATRMPYHQYEVRAPLSLATEGLMAPWFEQPGGGAMVVLGYPIRWHLDHGELVELVDP